MKIKRFYLLNNLRPTLCAKLKSLSPVGSFRCTSRPMIGQNSAILEACLVRSRSCLIAILTGRSTFHIIMLNYTYGMALSGAGNSIALLGTRPPESAALVGPHSRHSHKNIGWLKNKRLIDGLLIVQDYILQHQGEICKCYLQDGLLCYHLEVLCVHRLFAV